MPISMMEPTPILFGHDPRTSVVAVEPAGPFVRLFTRQGTDVSFQDLPFTPFILVDSPSRLTGCSIPCSIRQLQGEGRYCYQLNYGSWGACCAAHDYLEKTAARHAGGEAPFLWINDLSHQYLLATGMTLFKGMEYDQLRVMALDIETSCAVGYEFSNPLRPDDRIISVALKDSYGEELVLGGDQLAEPELLQALNNAIRRLDPDVIVGHNIFRFDLDYLVKRARLHGIPLCWGRNGSELHVTPHSRWNLAERIVEYPRCDVYGRHILDTYFLVQLYDLGTRNIESYGLKPVARHFGLAAPDRTYLDGEQIGDVFRDDPQRLFDYNLDDVRETLALFRVVGYPWFLQSQIFPYSFQNCPLKGNATRINALLLREYLHRQHAIPERTGEAERFEGGYTEILHQGVVGPVVHCDVASLYPSLMLTYRLGTRKDPLGIFLPMLATLRSFRLDAKQAERSAQGDEERAYWGSLQQVFKVVINSFFGYLGSARHNFSDPETAAEVTRLGRVTVKQMLEGLRREGAEPLEVDTDGIYFKPPPDCELELQERELVAKLSRQLPEGIEVEHDGRYRTMLAYKAKNYALLDYDDGIIIRGSSLKSRGIERYLREFMREVITLLLHGKGGEVERLYQQYGELLRSRTLPVALVARTETINESPASYQEKVRNGKRNPSAAFEIALKGERPYCAGDQVSYYVCGAAKDPLVYEQCRSVAEFNPLRPDINVPYYLEKLRHLKKRFEQFLPPEPTLFDF